MNSTKKPNFKVVFYEKKKKKSTCGSRKQCTGPTKKIHLLRNAQNTLPKLTHW